MNHYLTIIAVVALILGLIVNDVEDHLIHHFGQGLTSGLDQDSYWYPDGERKYDDNGKRKTIFGRSGWKPIDYVQEVPALWYDGWHLMKIFRQFFFGLALWAWGFAWYTNRRRMLRIEEPVKEPVTTAAVFMLIYGLIVYILHAIFYDGVFK